MKKMIFATAILLAFAVSAQATQPCAARAKGGLRTTKSYDNLLTTAGVSTVKTASDAKGTK